MLSELFLAAVISLPLCLSMESSSLSINALTLYLMLVGPLPPFFFLTRKVCQHNLWDVMPYAWSLVFLFSDPFVFHWFFSGSHQE